MFTLDETTRKDTHQYLIDLRRGGEWDMATMLISLEYVFMLNAIEAQACLFEWIKTLQEDEQDVQH